MVIWLVASLVLVMVAGLVAAVVAFGIDDSEPEPRRTQRVSDAELVAFDDPIGGYQLSVPTGWVVTAVHGDTAGLGADVFPDDTRKAEHFQQLVGLLPRVVVFVGLPEDELGSGRFVTNLNINAVPEPRDLTTDELADEMRRGIETFGEPAGDEPFAMAAGSGVRIEYDYSEVPASGVMYAVVQDGQAWTLNFASSDVSANAALFDAVAASFEVID